MHPVDTDCSRGKSQQLAPIIGQKAREDASA